MDWESAWELYCDTHMNPDWYDFEREFYGDEKPEPEEDTPEDEE